MKLHQNTELVVVFIAKVEIHEHFCIANFIKGERGGGNPENYLGTTRFMAKKYIDLSVCFL